MVVNTKWPARPCRARPPRGACAARQNVDTEMSGEIAIIQSRTVEEPNCPIADRAPSQDARAKSQNPSASL